MCLPICRINCDEKGRNANISSHPLVDIVQMPNNHAANEPHIKESLTDSKNTESFDVLVTCSSSSGSKVAGVAHQLLKPDEHSHGSGKL